MTISGVTVGERLRAVRRQKGLSLHDVEASSSHEFKASVLGAYERGERAITVSRLMRLARTYGVPADQLLPNGIELELDITDESTRSVGDGFMVDLVRLSAADDPVAALLLAYTAKIQLLRQDFNGRVLTIRGDDLKVLAPVTGRTSNQFCAHLDDLGLRAGVS